MAGSCLMCLTRYQSYSDLTKNIKLVFHCVLAYLILFSSGIINEVGVLVFIVIFHMVCFFHFVDNFIFNVIPSSLFTNQKSVQHLMTGLLHMLISTIMTNFIAGLPLTLIITLTIF